MKETILTRLARIEMKLDNHLHTHDIITKCILAPIFVGIILLVVKIYFMK